MTRFGSDQRYCDALRVATIATTGSAGDDRASPEVSIKGKFIRLRHNAAKRISFDDAFHVTMFFGAAVPTCTFLLLHVSASQSWATSEGAVALNSHAGERISYICMYIHRYLMYVCI